VAIKRGLFGDSNGDLSSEHCICLQAEDQMKECDKEEHWYEALQYEP
jgi:hypothetical protein